MKSPVKRLIDYCVPSHYSLAITQDSENLTFTGKVEISAQIIKLPLTLHSSDLDIQSVIINGKSCKFATNEKAQELEIEGATIGDAEIAIGFSGHITKQMHGLYPCFFAHDGIEKRLLATQFESHHAREVFPCVDEPEAKATFQLCLGTDASDTVLSNTPIMNEEVDGVRKLTTFEPTPKMSTYLLAWVSGELIYHQAYSQHGVKVRTYATPVHEGKLEFATDVLCKAMDYLDEYFDIPYPLKKFDQVALPDFAAGAMENWGCVTFRESALLFDPSQSDLSDKQHIADVVIHELAHQWFGNLVTMRWWNDLWLNEGFASWIPYLVRDKLFPEWNVWEHFATGDLAIGLRADALQNTHPIVVTINSPDEIRSAFDSISYDKGCSVINLLFHYIGETAFRDGLRSYLKKHAYANAETYDLWSAWDVASGKDVSGFMKTWTEEPGFPMVTVSNTQISQSRFYLDAPADPATTLWPIPLMTTSSDTGVLSESVMETTQKSKLNIGQSGFYRAVYTGRLGEELKTKLANGELSNSDSIGLITDASEASKAGYYSTTDALDMYSAIRTVYSEQLFGTVLGELAEIRTILSDTFESQKKFVSYLIEPNLRRLGIDALSSDTIDDELLRPSILSAASYSGNEEVVGWALQLFESAEMPEAIRPEIRGIIYQTAVRENNDQATHQKLLRWYEQNTIPGERTTLAASLANFRDPDLALESLAQITSDKVKLQDSLYWIAYGLRNRWNKQLAWTWVQENWDWVTKNFGKEKEIDYYLRFCASGFADDAHLKSYTEFFESMNIYGSTRAFEQGKETIRWQSAWKKRDMTKVDKWFKSFTK